MTHIPITIETALAVVAIVGCAYILGYWRGTVRNESMRDEARSEYDRVWRNGK